MCTVVKLSHQQLVLLIWHILKVINENISTCANFHAKVLGKDKISGRAIRNTGISLYSAITTSCSRFLGCYLCVQFRSRLTSPNLNEHQSWSKAECTATFPWLAFLFAWQSKWTTIADLGHKFKFYTLYQVDELSIFKKHGLFFCLFSESIWNVFILQLVHFSFVHFSAIFFVRLDKVVFIVDLLRALNESSVGCFDLFSTELKSYMIEKTLSSVSLVRRNK